MKKLLFLLAIIIISAQASAERVDRQTAERAAASWMELRQPGAVPVEVFPIVYSGDTTCYFFNFEPDGFVIVSAEDAVTPILGYSIEGRYTGRMIPPAQEYFDYVGKSITDVRAAFIRADERVATEWRELTNQSAGQFLKPAKGTLRLPLVVSLWGQDDPFNLACPEGSCDRGEFSNSKMLTGCIATSMAMIMMYYKYPTHGTGIREDVNFGEATYNWSILFADINSSSIPSVKNEVSEVMYHAGIAADMTYGCTASSATLVACRAGLINYFGYKNTARIVIKDNTDDDVWHELLKTEIDALRPVLYSGLTPDKKGGHAFVLDGYDYLTSKKMYRFNWGWYGYLNGYFTLESLKPASDNDYTTDQQAIIGIEPGESQTSSPHMQVTPSTWVAPKAGGTSTAFNVVNSASGSATVIEYTITSNATWLTTSKLAGSTPGSFVVTAEPNPGTSSRSGTITISTSTTGVENPTATITVNQSATDTSSANDTLKVSLNTWSAPMAGGFSPYVSVTTGSRAVAFSASSSVSWARLTALTGSTPGGFTISADANNSGAARSGYINVSVTDGTIFGSPVQIPIYQTGTTAQQVLLISRTEWNVTNSGGTSPVVSVTNGNTSTSPIQYTISESVSWLTISSTGGTTPGSFTVTAESNPSDVKRTGTITIQSVATGVLGSPATFTVTQDNATQSGKPLLSVSQTTWVPPAGGGTSASVSVTNGSLTNSSAIPFTAISDATWLTVTPAFGATPASLTLTASPNNTSMTRFAVVRIAASISDVEGSPTSIQITQPPSTTDAPVLSVSPSVVIVPSDGHSGVRIDITNTSSTNPSNINYSIEDQVTWITASAANGTTPGVVNLQMAPNTGVARTGAISIIANGASGSPAPVTIYQCGKLAGSNIEVSLSQWAIDASSNQSPSIHVLGTGQTSGIPYKIRTNAAWLSTSWTYGITPGMFTITTSQNNTKSARTGTIYIYDELNGVAGSEHVLTVVQQPSAGTASMSVSMSAWSAPVGGGSSPTVYVTNNSTTDTTGITYSVTVGAAWLSATNLNGRTPGEFLITAQPNTNAGSRSGTVTVTSSRSGVLNSPQIIAVTQPGYATNNLSCSTASTNSPNINSRPGDRFNIQVNLAKAISSSNGTIDLSFVLNFDVLGLYPVDAEAVSGRAWIERVSGGVVRVHCEHRSFAAGALVKIRIETLLGTTTSPAWWLSTPSVSNGVTDIGVDESCRGTVYVSPRNGFDTRSDLGIASLASVFPNPVQSVSASGIEVDVEKEGIVEIRLYSGMGKEVGRVYTGHLSVGRHRLPVQVGVLPAGVYLVVMNTAEGPKAKSFILQR